MIEETAKSYKVVSEEAIQTTDGIFMPGDVFESTQEKMSFFVEQGYVEEVVSEQLPGHLAEVVDETINETIDEELSDSSQEPIAEVPHVQENAMYRVLAPIEIKDGASGEVQGHYREGQEIELDTIVGDAYVAEGRAEKIEA